ncbi:MAG: patatin-like phospholipase family protein [Candidatus Rokubacteria bacterium]|nr:patatin-like phospholipase family protein [Candidatus Rokubacteria bacterium]
MKRETVLLLQGGGALGAYECGVYKALEEAGIIPDLVAGVSIGAVNAAIIAGNPRGRAAQALEAFWHEIAVPGPFVLDEGLRRFFAAWQIAMFGVPKLFVPRWFSPRGLALPPLTWTSLYDPSPLRQTLAAHVDPERLASPEIRLILTAVDVESGELEVFDSAERRITVDHILASGSFPPGFPWTVIGERAYWDGGLVSNTLLGPVMERQAGVPMKVYLVSLFPRARPLPTNLPAVLARRKDILHSDRMENDLRGCEQRNDALDLIQELVGHLQPETADRVRRSPRYRRIVDQACRVEITRFSHDGEAFESESKDYDFSTATIREHLRRGYQEAHAILAREAVTAGLAEES